MSRTTVRVALIIATALSGSVLVLLVPRLLTGADVPAWVTWTLVGLVLGCGVGARHARPTA